MYILNELNKTIRFLMIVKLWTLNFKQDVWKKCISTDVWQIFRVVQWHSLKLFLAVHHMIRFVNLFKQNV